MNYKLHINLENNSEEINLEMILKIQPKTMTITKTFPL